MSQITSVYTEKAPAPISLFSQAQIFNGLVYCSGNIGTDPNTNKPVDGTVTNQTVQAIQNMSIVLEASGSSLRRVIKVNVYIASMTDFAAMNEGYAKFFSDPFPVYPGERMLRSNALPHNLDVEELD
ncbi:hypothetical protein LTR10_018296 [Elasticomyces elasticus]|uniref:Uncharacterized protein n=1 Tax=Exophiala sideris TaxID=1016849 RepID=A0ABR0JM64_9EURO|nr:hypothetical protein LTR10_018296 [Elasticomyces elasticus]KAK5036686.1 hypothetical protein LTS07_002414 [Exophiala sideris]KAK5067070.1 hypothetical protein LTR69_002419 [Exophiala sideris]KAK5185128.1 hypothetical protein LTR44_002975 [Eurotiomycetes sp. CCFEE 6388]